MDSLSNTGYFLIAVRLKNRSEANKAILYDNFAKDGAGGGIHLVVFIR
jgi:hypothetical protein